MLSGHVNCRRIVELFSSTGTGTRGSVRAVLSGLRRLHSCASIPLQDTNTSVWQQPFISRNRTCYWCFLNHCIKIVSRDQPKWGRGGKTDFFSPQQQFGSSNTPSNDVQINQSRYFLPSDLPMCRNLCGLTFQLRVATRVREEQHRHSINTRLLLSLVVIFTVWGWSRNSVSVCYLCSGFGLRGHRRSVSRALLGLISL